MKSVPVSLTAHGDGGAHNDNVSAHTAIVENSGTDSDVVSWP